MKTYKDWSVFSKIMSISMISALLLVLVALFALTPFIKGLILTEKDTALRSLLQQTTSMLAFYQKQVESGLMTKEEAQKQASERIAAMRYNGADYIWINDSDAKILMHPIKPELVGKSLYNDRDANGKYFLRDLVNQCTEKGVAKIEYVWPKPGTNKLVPKISRGELFRPWGWVVCTGIYVDDVAAQMVKIQVRIFGSLVVLLGLTSAIGLYVSRTITRPVAELMTQAGHMAEGNLQVHIASESADEIGRLAHTFNNMAAHLRKIIQQVVDTSTAVSTAATQVYSTSELMATGAEEVAAQSGTIATASEEMAATSTDIARNCHLAANSAQHAAVASKEGVAIAHQTTEGIRSRIAKTAENAEIISALGDRSDQIGAIVGTIEDIADQTNLLALNAAIEAARAGEMGRGFAVVADEVRALAERTTKATKEIGEMIKAMQSETYSAVNSMKIGVENSQGAIHDAERLEVSLKNILDMVGDVSLQVSQIATAAEEQTATTNEISNNMVQISDVVCQTAQGAHESAAAANQLNKAADGLQSMIQMFKL